MLLYPIPGLERRDKRFISIRFEDIEIDAGMVLRSCFLEQPSEAHLTGQLPDYHIAERFALRMR